jgi:hypothetical protein
VKSAGSAAEITMWTRERANPRHPSSWLHAECPVAIDEQQRIDGTGGHHRGSHTLRHLRCIQAEFGRCGHDNATSPGCSCIDLNDPCPGIYPVVEPEKSSARQLLLGAPQARSVIRSTAGELSALPFLARRRGD